MHPIADIVAGELSAKGLRQCRLAGGSSQAWSRATIYLQGDTGASTSPGPQFLLPSTCPPWKHSGGWPGSRQADNSSEKLFRSKTDKMDWCMAYTRHKMGKCIGFNQAWIRLWNIPWRRILDGIWRLLEILSGMNIVFTDSKMFVTLFFEIW